MSYRRDSVGTRGVGWRGRTTHARIWPCRPRRRTTYSHWPQKSTFRATRPPFPLDRSMILRILRERRDDRTRTTRTPFVDPFVYRILMRGAGWRGNPTCGPRRNLWRGYANGSDRPFRLSSDSSILPGML